MCQKSRLKSQKELLIVKTYLTSKLFLIPISCFRVIFVKALQKYQKFYWPYRDGLNLLQGFQKTEWRSMTAITVIDQF